MNIAEVFTNAFTLASLFYLSLGWTLVRAQLTSKEHNLINYGILSYFAFDIAASVCLDGGNVSEGPNIIIAD